MTEQSTMELTHQDLVMAFDRIVEQLEAADKSAILRSLDLGMFDTEDLIRVLRGFKSRVIVDAHLKGVLEWK
jgi:hypothetical protein